MSLTVLAVDDSRTMRDMLNVALGQEGFEVHLAENGVDGLDVLAQCQPDVIITDINMPRMNGFEFIEEVRQIDAHRTVPILTLTTESAPELKARARAAGATGWITKPFDKNKLIAVIHRVAA